MNKNWSSHKKSFFISHNIRMLNLSLNEMKLVAKNKGIKGYKSMSKEKLFSVFSEPELVGSEKHFDDKIFKNIRKDFNEWRYKFSKSKINEIRRSLYGIKNQKNLSKSKIKKIEENLYELEKSLFKLKKYYDYDDTEYIRIRDIENLFHQSTEYYYKPTETTNSFDNKNNYIEYESKEGKDKNLSPKEYLDMIKSYLSNMINNHKAQEV